jgi:hypothetical protein
MLANPDRIDLLNGGVVRLDEAGKIQWIKNTVICKPVT